ncbi:MAG: carboxylesterase family protein [Caulobacter sp.]
MMRVCFLAAAFLLTVVGVADAAPVTRTHGGPVRGVVSDGVEAYLGVPFAAPPLGALRWRPPAPSPSWRKVRDVTRFAPACPQRGVSMPGEPPPRTSEDCLYLNVWTPQRSGRKPLPVIVWIHGGGYVNGATSLPLYDGGRLARRGAVVVSVAYRLGPLGWLAHPELTTESGGHGSGDYGLMDQIAALEWVRRNIAAFDGDPGRVTIAGQSAGGMSVSLLMASPEAKGLFHRAIAQSGGVFEPLQIAPQYSQAGAEREGADYAASLGADTIAKLRALPVERLLEGRKAQAINHPVVGPSVLPLSPYQAYAAGRHNPAPILVGFNAEEALSLTDLSRVRAATFRQDLAKAFGPLPPAILDAYPYSDNAQARRARADLERDLRFGWDMWTWARLQQARGGAVYVYRFDRRPPFPEGLRGGWGAGHFAELWYMFDQLDQEPWAWTRADRDLAHAMAGYWVNFAATGDPNGEGLPSWPRFTDEAGPILSLGDSISPTELRLDALRAFDAAYDGVRRAPISSAVAPR